MLRTCKLPLLSLVRSEQRRDRPGASCDEADGRLTSASRIRQAGRRDSSRSDQKDGKDATSSCLLTQQAALLQKGELNLGEPCSERPKLWASTCCGTCPSRLDRR